MARTITFTGNTLRQYIFGIDEHESREEYDKYKEEFYYHGSSNRRAQRSMMQNNPNVEPIGFCIPSELYSDYYMLHQYRNGSPVYARMPEEDWNEYKKPPQYIITGRTSFGGHYDYTTAVITLKEFKTSIRISNCAFINSVEIHQLESSSYIHFSNCIFNQPIIILETKATKITFSNCDFVNNKISIVDCALEKLTISNCKNIAITINNDVPPVNSYIKINDFDHNIKSILFSELFNVESIDIKAGNINSIEFKDFISRKTTINLNVDNLQISNNTINNEKQDYFFIDELAFTINAKNENLISLLENIHIGIFTVSGTLKSSTINIINTKVNKLFIHDFINEGKFRFNDVEITDEGEGEIVRSQLSKAEFNYVDFSKANRFKIFLSNITEIVTNNTIFPVNIVGKDENDFKGIREIYRQLKNAAGKQGDRINELYYEKLEMSTLEKILTKSKNWNDRLILWSNKVSNDYGQDWTLSLSVLLMGSLYLFVTIKLTLYSMQFDTPPTFEHLAQYINFTLNPLHKFSDIFYNYPKDINSTQLGFAQVLDAISRLFSGYMIFQFLKAFRKYVR
ncbi:hypothetical protein [Spirosoma litoris]